LNTLQLSEQHAVKGTFYSIPDNTFIDGISDYTKTLLNKDDNVLDIIPAKEMNLNSLDPRFFKVYDILISKNSSIPDYDSAVKVGQKVAEDIISKEPNKIPLINLIDTKFGKPTGRITSKIFDNPALKEHPFSIANPGLNMFKSTTTGVTVINSNESNDSSNISKDIMNKFGLELKDNYSVPLSKDTFDKLTKSVSAGDVGEMVEFIHHFKTVYIFESTTPNTLFKINHELNSEFLITKIWIKEDDGNWYSDSVRERIDDENNLTILLSEPKNIRVIIRKESKNLTNMFRFNN